MAFLLLHGAARATQCSCTALHRKSMAAPTVGERETRSCSGCSKHFVEASMGHSKFVQCCALCLARISISTRSQLITQAGSRFAMQLGRFAIFFENGRIRKPQPDKDIQGLRLTVPGAVVLNVNDVLGWVAVADVFHAFQRKLWKTVHGQ